MKKVLFVFIFLLIAAGCNNTPTDNTTSQPTSQVKESANQTLTEKCAQQSQVVLENARFGQDAITNTTSQNHYNTILGKCFVYITQSSADGNTLTISSWLEDAYEQRPLLDCFSGTDVKPYCFTPANASATGKAVWYTQDEGQTQINGYLSQ